MIGRLVRWSSAHPWLVLAVALCLGVVGALARRGLRRDVLPDLSDPQIGVVVTWMGHSGPDVAANVTKPLADAFAGIPGAAAVRETSMSGMAYLEVVFASSASLDAGRTTISNRVEAVRSTLPSDARVEVGPAASSVGWVFEYALVSFEPGSLVPGGLQNLQDTVLRPELEAIAGVAEVATVGSGGQQLVVEAKPEELRKRGLAFTDMLSAVRSAIGPDRSLAPRALLDAPVRVSPETGEQTRIGDVAKLSMPAEMSNGLPDYADSALVASVDRARNKRGRMPMGPAMSATDGSPETLGGVVIARRDADVTAVVGAVERALDRVQTRLPRGVRVIPVYDRRELVERVDATLATSLGEEVALVAFVVLVFLLHGRSALVPLITLPLVLLLTFTGMWLLRVQANVMSVGGIGIALGIAVDAEIVALEACHRQLQSLSKTATPGERRARILAGASIVAPAILTSLVITGVTFLPVFAFTGEPRRLLTPLAITKTLVIASAAIVSLTVGPALRDRLLRGRIVPEFHNPLSRALVRAYRPFVDFALRRPALTLATAGLALLSCLPIALRLGAEFLPRVDEGDLLFMPTTLAGAPPMEAAEQLHTQDLAMARFKEVASVFGKVGRVDSATDPAPFSMAETTIRLRPRAEWPMQHRARWYSGWAPGPVRRVLGFIWPEESPCTTAELVDRLDAAVRSPGWSSAWTTPVRARMDMMSTGVRTPLAVRLSAGSEERLDALGAAVRDALLPVPGTRSVVVEGARDGETWPDFEADPAALARFGVEPAQLRSTVSFLRSGGRIGEVSWGPRRLQLRVTPEAAGDRELSDEMLDTTLRDRAGAPVPLGLLGRPTFVNEPAMVRSEQGELVSYVYVDLDQRTDIQGYVEQAQRALDAASASGALHLAPGEHLDWAGQYRLLETGARRLRWIAPAVVLLMLGLLFVQFRSLAASAIVLLSVPFALVGSVWTLHLLHYPLSAPVWVGLLATAGLAMQTSVVMVVYIDEAFYRRVREGRLRCHADVVAAHAEGTVRRLRPKVMTIITMVAGLLPLLWAQGAGAEILRRVAAPMVGGLVTSAFLTLEVLPVVYTIWRQSQLRRALASGVAIEAIVGTRPPWAKSSEDPRGQHVSGGPSTTTGHRATELAHEA
jgi:Cu(I)/Ag(I) efflux system membrane protein CusA/SilA